MNDQEKAKILEDFLFENLALISRELIMQSLNNEDFITLNSPLGALEMFFRNEVIL